MRFLFGLWTVTVALTVSAVAAYYSIIGLTAIFAAAVIPVIIMGTALEVAKITTAIWLHSFWSEAPALMKTYLTSATVVLMLITSMGIFGFLSKAHIEQSAGSSELSARIERIDQEIQRRQETIERANLAIESFDTRVSRADQDIQARIQTQEEIIDNIQDRLERDIAVQQEIISQEQGVLEPLQNELSRLEQRRERFEELVANDDIVELQRLIGAEPDGVFGPNTSRLANEFEQELSNRRTDILQELERLQQSDNQVVQQAREEIQRLQQSANAEIERAQEAINAFRNQLVSVTTQDNSNDIQEQQQIIDQTNDEIDTLLTDKFDLESQLRVLEVEVGPVKYIAELVYGETNTELLEKAVRWVIIILVFVFDPLAVVLVLAGIRLLHCEENVDNQDENTHNEQTISKDQTVEETDAVEPENSSDDDSDDITVEKEISDNTEDKTEQPVQRPAAGVATIPGRRPGKNNS